MKKQILVLLFASLFILHGINGKLYTETSDTILPENIIVTCDLTDLPQKLPYLKIVDEKIDKEALLSQWLQEKSLSAGEKITVLSKEFTRYLSSDKRIIVEFGPYGYVFLKAKKYIKNPEFLTLGKADEIAERFIKEYFGEIPSDSVRKSERYRNNFGEEGFKITYTRKYEGYEILSTEEYLGDIIEVRIYKNGDFEFERMWHRIEGFSDLMYGDLTPIEEVLNKLFWEEVKSGKKIYIQGVEILYYFNPMDILTINSMRPVYRINGNGKYYYADGFNGERIPVVRKTVRSLKKKPPRRVLVPVEERE